MIYRVAYRRNRNTIIKYYKMRNFALAYLKKIAYLPDLKFLSFIILDIDSPEDYDI